MTVSISVFVLGYGGFISASHDQKVSGPGLNPDEVEMIEHGRSPIIEASMDELVARGNRACRLDATVDSTAALFQSDASFVCVGTPSLRNRACEGMCW